MKILSVLIYYIKFQIVAYMNNIWSHYASGNELSLSRTLAVLNIAVMCISDTATVFETEMAASTDHRILLSRCPINQLFAG